VLVYATFLGGNGDNGLGGNSLRVTKVVIDPTNPAIVYMGSNQGMFRTANGGALWTSINTGALSPFAPQTFVGTPILLQFTSADYVVNEEAGSIQINVRRTGDLSGVTTVDYATVDGTAAARTDYTSAFGTLRFGPGESLKSFTVLITDDNLVEGWESLTLSLSNPTGAIFDSPFQGPPAASTTSLLEIRDNDVAQPTSNPLDDAQFFVREQYVDFLNREPDAGGLGYWSSEINKCGSDRECPQ
jgi:hypothetical protein